MNSIDDSLKNYQIVKETNLVLILNSKLLLIKNDTCNVLAINLRPLNDIGSGLIATETLIYLTNNGNYLI